MDEFDSELNNLNLTPFKISICSLLYSFTFQDNYLNDNILNKKDQSFLYYEVIDNLIGNYSNEFSKETLINSIKNIFVEISKENYKLNENQIEKLIENFINNLNYNLCNIKNINDIYCLFKDNIPKIRNIQNSISFNLGGHLDNYLRKCLNSFNKLSFQGLIKLYEDIIKFNNNTIINISLSSKENENLFSEYFSNFSLNKNLKYLDNFKQKFLLECNNNINNNQNNSLAEKIFSLHKFYDYNLKYLYNENLSSNENKIHYSLLYLTNLYYECGYYNKAIQILFECFKLSQSNSDHEALLKCFLWLSLIYIQIGNFKLASQCLSTCLIKSFQNNFQLLYLNSSIELSNLNFIFHSTIGFLDKKIESKNISLDLKILSHSNNYSQLFKNLSDYYTLKDKEINNDELENLISYSNIHLIFNLLLKGEYALAIQYIKIVIKEIFKIYLDKNTELTESHNEILFGLINLMLNILDYDYKLSIEVIYNILNLKNFQDNLIINKEYIFWIIINKYCCEYQNYTYKLINNNKNFYNIGIFYLFINEYYNLYYEFNKPYELKTNEDDFENNLIIFINKCDEYHINSYKISGKLLLSKFYIEKERFTESEIILNKIIYYDSISEGEKIKCYIYLAYIYYYLKSYQKTEEIINNIQLNIENYCNISEKFDYYYLYTIFYKDKKFINLCLKYSLILNNSQKIEKCMEAYNLYINVDNEKNKNENELQNIINEHIEKNNKLFNILNLFNISVKEGLEILYEITKNNIEFFEENKIN